MQPQNNKYGSLKFLSKNVSHAINKIMTNLDSKNINYTIYYGYPVINQDHQKNYVKGILITESKIILLYEHKQEVDLYGSTLLKYLSSDPDLFFLISNYKDYVIECELHSFSKEQDIKSILENSTSNFSMEQLEKINRAIQVSFNLTSNDNRIIKNKGTLGEKLKSRNTYIGNYDSTQFNAIHSPIENHQRIRGLAGSGKTVLMIKKLAFIHFHYPDLNLAYIFYTTSLKQDVTNKFKSYYKDYDPLGQPDMSKVSIFHGWGGKKTTGFYSDICERSNSKFYSYGEANLFSRNEINPFEFACSQLIDELDSIGYEGYYDFIFVDEAQDFEINFFKLCLKSLKKTDLTEYSINTGFLIYAYDELQSLGESTKIPSKKDIFGDENLCEDINLKKCYRTPLEILTTAHAIGLGVYRETDNENEHPLVNIFDEQTMVDTGYTNLTGDFEEGKQVILEREESEQGVTLENPQTFESERDQYAFLANKILDLIEHEDILPNDIMIIDLDDKYISTNYINFAKCFHENRNSRENIDKNTSVNLVYRNNPLRVKIDNNITYTTIYRAKGNESNLVFLINCNPIKLSSKNSTIRNKIFTGMTRAKWLVWLYSTSDMSDYCNEIKQVKDNNYTLNFIYPTKEQQQNIKRIGDEDKRLEDQVASLESIIKDLPDLPDLPIEILEELLKRKKNKK